MIKYTVTWRESAQQDLARIWLDSSDRRQITTATNEIDRTLGRDALEKGMILSQFSRELIVEPIKVLFTVNDDDRIVEIFKVSESNP
jgi:mRNA-degrading endonuclease RelE of RelBE toxin-antitoxin system